MMKRNQKGITLIALVITIIIMLILAGVALNIALGENGILKMSQKVADEYKQKAQEEQNTLSELEKKLGNFTTNNPGENTTITPPTGSIGSTEVENNLKQYQGKYVDIGLDVDGEKGTTNDWEIFYVNGGRIFLIAADYVPSSKLREWKVIGDGTSLGSIGFTDVDDSHKYGVFWPKYPTKFLDLPKEPDNFLNLVMLTGYDLNANREKVNSMAASYLLNKDSWDGIKTSSTKSDCIDFVIGGPTLEMWCAAWKVAINGNTNGYVEIKPGQSNEFGYYVSSSKEGMQNKPSLYMDGTQTAPDREGLETLGTLYKTFFPHVGTEAWNNCNGYWISSPSSFDFDDLMCVRELTRMGTYSINGGEVTVRPLISLMQGVQLTETAENQGIYNINK